MPGCDHLYGCDYRWWKYHIGSISDLYEGRCWTQDIQWEDTGKKVDPAQWGITQLTSLERPGLSIAEGIIHQGKNSGYQAVNLALLLGAERIIMLGFDMGMAAGKRHFFGEHPQPMNMASNYADFIKKFETIKPAEYGVEIWNVSRNTALKCFPIYDLDDLHAGFSARDRTESQPGRALDPAVPGPGIRPQQHVEGLPA